MRRLLCGLILLATSAGCEDPVDFGPEDPEIAHLAVGADHACAADVRGNVFCWGSNDRSQLSSTVDGFSTVAGLSLIGSDVGELTAGAGYTCKLTRDGVGTCWGDGRLGQLGNGLPFISPIGVAVRGGPWSTLSTGPYHVCGTGAGGTECWGGDRYGAALGQQLPVESRCTNNVTGDRWWCALDPLSVAAPEALSGLSAGAVQSCGIGASGGLFCWGQNEFSQLGFTSTEECFVPDSPGSFTCAFTPGQVSLPGPVRAVAAGGNHTCAVLVSGDAYCWGSWYKPLGRSTLYYGQLGSGSAEGSAVPVKVALAEPLRSITTTRRDILSSTCGLTEQGRAFCWGSNGSGALGAASTDTCILGGENVECSLTPVAVETDVRFTQLGLGEGFACGLTDKHRVLCWGRNDRGQLGDGTTTSRSDPQPIAFLN